MTPPPEPNVPAVVAEPSPIPVSVYYAEALRNHSCTGGKGYIAFDWTFTMGPPSVDMFNAVLADMFERVRIVDTSPATGPMPETRHVIEIRLIEFSGCDARWPIVGTTTVVVGYEAILWSPEGEELTRWRARGTAGPHDAVGEYMKTTGEAAYLSALTSLAMRNAATDFVLNLEKDSLVRANLFPRPN